MASSCCWKNKFLLLNSCFLFLCASMYLGTGGSLIFFSFPIAPQLTPENYYLQFVPQVHAATDFFTPMTKAMLISGIIMLIAEWKNCCSRWASIGLLVALIAATALTRYGIFPVNEEMASHIKDPKHLHDVLDHWMQLNRWRVLCWVVEWICMMGYFASWTFKSRYPK
jgi:Domain of unknown function (DUF1772)